MASSGAVILWRSGHAVIAVGFLFSIGYVWWCAITRRRGPLLRGAVGALIAEGVLVAANRGDCPLGSLGNRIGDEVPLFELVLPRRAAKAAIPVLGAVTGAGLIALAVRSPSGRPDQPFGFDVQVRQSGRLLARYRRRGAAATSAGRQAS